MRISTTWPLHDLNTSTLVSLFKSVDLFYEKNMSGCWIKVNWKQTGFGGRLTVFLNNQNNTALINTQMAIVFVLFFFFGGGGGTNSRTIVTIKGINNNIESKMSLKMHHKRLHWNICRGFPWIWRPWRSSASHHTGCGYLLFFYLRMSK